MVSIHAVNKGPHRFSRRRWRWTLRSIVVVGIGLIAAIPVTELLYVRKSDKAIWFVNGKVLRDPGVFVIPFWDKFHALSTKRHERLRCIARNGDGQEIEAYLLAEIELQYNFESQLESLVAETDDPEEFVWGNFEEDIKKAFQAKTCYYSYAELQKAANDRAAFVRYGPGEGNNRAIYNHGLEWVGVITITNVRLRWE